MDVHIDWVSFTLPMATDITSHMSLLNHAKAKLREISDEHYLFVFQNNAFEAVQSRAPYSYALGPDGGGIRLFGGGSTRTILFELSGRWCEGIHDYDAACRFLSPVSNRITRVDIAVDVRCETRPSTFANVRSHKGFRSISFIQSDTGETVYVGSPKSDRFARCYRYNSPHPRSALLRIEFVFRKGLAKAACDAFINAGGVHRIAVQLGNTWGFSHPIWKPEIKSDERLKSPKLARGDEQTEMWLYKQVSPAIQRLLRESEFDLSAWLEYTLTGVKSTDDDTVEV